MLRRECTVGHSLPRPKAVDTALLQVECSDLGSDSGWQHPPPPFTGKVTWISQLEGTDDRFTVDHFEGKFSTEPLAADPPDFEVLKNSNVMVQIFGDDTAFETQLINRRFKLTLLSENDQAGSTNETKSLASFDIHEVSHLQSFSSVDHTWPIIAADGCHWGFEARPIIHLKPVEDEGPAAQEV